MDKPKCWVKNVLTNFYCINQNFNQLQLSLSTVNFFYCIFNPTFGVKTEFVQVFLKEVFFFSAYQGYWLKYGIPLQFKSFTHNPSEIITLFVILGKIWTNTAIGLHF